MNSDKTLPADPFILYSVINTKLRDYYPTLDHLCVDMEISKEELTFELGQLGFYYNESTNQFV